MTETDPGWSDQASPLRAPPLDGRGQSAKARELAESEAAPSGQKKSAKPSGASAKPTAPKKPKLDPAAAAAGGACEDGSSSGMDVGSGSGLGAFERAERAAAMDPPLDPHEWELFGNDPIGDMEGVGSILVDAPAAAPPAEGPVAGLESGGAPEPAGPAGGGASGSAGGGGGYARPVPPGPGPGVPGAVLGPIDDARVPPGCIFRRREPNGRSRSAGKHPLDRTLN